MFKKVGIIPNNWFPKLKDVFCCIQIDVVDVTNFLPYPFEISGISMPKLKCKLIKF